jgi:hypothetical protein
MKTHALTLSSLGALAALMNLSWAVDGRVSIPDREGQACEVPSDSRDWIETWMPAMSPLVEGCEGCTLSDTIVQTYCESRGSDCDGLFGINESYLWTREKYIYQCGQPGQPGYGWFVECSTWALDGCCDDGTEGLPPTGCTHSGAAHCSSRTGDN